MYIHCTCTCIQITLDWYNSSLTTENRGFDGSTRLIPEISGAFVLPGSVLLLVAVLTPLTRLIKISLLLLAAVLTPLTRLIEMSLGTGCCEMNLSGLRICVSESEARKLAASSCTSRSCCTDWLGEVDKVASQVGVVSVELGGP